jgi:transcriptional regulator with XRE-family HTH domain
MLTPLQLKLGRIAAGLGIRELAQLAGVAPSTINRFELGRGGMITTNMARVQKVLEDRGVIFIPADVNGGPGVREAGARYDGPG